MRPLPDPTVASLVLAGLVVLAAALLAWRESLDRGRREEDPSPRDARHFAHQDARRRFGLVVMVLLAAGLVYGSGLPPRAGNRANPAFVATWLGVFLLIFVLLALALIDWVALRHYARRHRSQILRERAEALRDEAIRLKALKAEGNGQANGSIHDPFP